jgi:hypothetical protein
MQCCCIDKFLKHFRRTGTKFARQKIYFRGDLALGSRPYLFKHLKLYNTAKFHTGIIKRTILLIPTPLLCLRLCTSKVPLLVLMLISSCEPGFTFHHYATLSAYTTGGPISERPIYFEYLTVIIF